MSAALWQQIDRWHLKHRRDAATISKTVVNGAAKYTLWHGRDCVALTETAQEAMKAHELGKGGSRRAP